MMSTKLRHFNCTFETLIIFFLNRVSNGKCLYLQKKLLRANTIASKYFHSFSVQQAPVGLFLCDSQGNTRSKKMCLPCRVYCLVSNKRLFDFWQIFSHVHFPQCCLINMRSESKDTEGKGKEYMYNVVNPENRKLGTNF